MTSHYAKDTKVPVDRSRGEIEHVLRKYGCTAFAFGWQIGAEAMIQFEYRGRNVKLTIAATKGAFGQAARERAERQRWRVLVLLVKAQIEAVENGLWSFEEAFLPWMLLGDGSTVAQKMLPQLPAAASPESRLREVKK